MEKMTLNSDGHKLPSRDWTSAYSDSLKEGGSLNPYLRHHMYVNEYKMVEIPHYGLISPSNPGRGNRAVPRDIERLHREDLMARHVGSTASS